MIGAFIAGALGGILFGGKKTVEKTTTRVIVRERPNELIEYHKWLEERERKRRFEEERRKRIQREYDFTHCSVCGCELRYTVAKSYDISSFGGRVMITVSCKCGAERKLVDFDHSNQQNIGDAVSELMNKKNILGKKEKAND